MANIIITGGTGFLSIDFNDLSDTYGYLTVDIPSNYTPMIIKNNSPVVELLLFDGRSIKLNPNDVDIPSNNGTAIDLRNKIKEL